MTLPSRLRHSGTALAHSVSPTAWRNSFTMRPADAIFAPAVKVGVAGTLVLVAGGLLGQEQLAGIASLGALVSAFGRYLPYGRLARQLVVVAVSLLIAAGLGALLGVAGVHLGLQVLALSLVGGAALYVFASFRINGPGPVILVFASAAGAGYARTPDDVGRVLLAVFLGAVIGWLVSMAPVLVAPMGPARLAAARALAAVVRVGAPAASRYDVDALDRAAAAAIRSARETVVLSTPAARADSSRAAATRSQGLALHHLLDVAGDARLLVGTGGQDAALDRLSAQETALRRRGRVLPGMGSGAPARDPAAARAEAASAGFLAAARAGLTSRTNVNQALRIVAASALSGWAAAGLGLEHPLWASMGAVATMQGLNYSITVQRGIQRLAGNVVGAILAVGLLSMALGFWPSAVLVVVFQVMAELLVLTNYTLTTIAVTPMALVMTALGAHLGPGAAVSRVADTLVGVVLGVVVAALSISLADRHHLRRA